MLVENGRCSGRFLPLTRAVLALLENNGESQGMGENEEGERCLRTLNPRTTASTATTGHNTNLYQFINQNRSLPKIYREYRFEVVRWEHSRSCGLRNVKEELLGTVTILERGLLDHSGLRESVIRG
ncbi:hypothetical protein AVEN_186119-1 [Araneus ventricosus]|uniref:Uncharacterized protein n=1 Tax=Araneus ventricosus TaxID=182803 RepID=A0A4Y2HDE4_ARAVE|nr:hypothetical protein AVEN_186119-1 [Araneus ventricosus]